MLCIIWSRLISPTLTACDFRNTHLFGLTSLNLRLWDELVVVLLLLLVLFTCVIHSCRRASCGRIRRSGSHCRHRSMKSINHASWQRSACERVLVPGYRFLPFEFAKILGLPLESNIRIFLVIFFLRMPLNVHTYRKTASFECFALSSIGRVYPKFPWCMPTALARFRRGIWEHRCTVLPKCSRDSTYQSPSRMKYQV